MAAHGKGGFQFDEYRSQVGLDDLVLLPKLDNESITHNLQIRAAKRIIYTYIGSVLIAMNPYRKLDIYTDTHLNQYRDKFRHELPPHIYMLAEDAFRTMLAEEESQCIIISGESGAGKTESAKFIMNYIAAVSKKAHGVEEVKRIVLGSNPLLEAFGNAKTLRNNNSSRFGKYVEMHFDLYGAPRGGHIRNYLLEKSRIVHQMRGERNFHVFYQLVNGSGSAIRKAFRLSKPEDFHYLKHSRCYTLDGVDEAQEFADTQQAMRMVGLKSKAQEAVFKLLAGVLHLGNVSFSEHGQGVAIVDGAVLQLACSFLDLDAAALEQALRFRHMVTRDEEFDVPLNTVQACTARDAVAKSIYAKLFDWLVSCVNDALSAVEERENENDDETLSINVLDIYGFEVFENNGFEQFLINYVNEKLQQIFIELTLKAEQEEYQREGIAWTPIKFFNNKVVCDLIESKNPPGVLSILDDVCATAHAESKGVDDKFAQKAAQFHGSHQHFTPGGAGFTVQHYAGPVMYNKQGFCAANKDALGKDLLGAISGTRSKFIKVLFKEDVKMMESKKPTTMGFKMKGQCAALVDALMSCNPHYVRCLKPNDVKSPDVFDKGRVIHQTKYLGLLENVRVRRAGFAYRQEFHRFNDRFKILVPSKKRRGKSDREICQNMLRYLAASLEVTKDDVQLGRTKLFIKKPETLNTAEELRQRRLGEAAEVIQKAWKRYKNREHLIKLRHSVNKFVGKHKARRRESLLRPFQSDYIHYRNCKDLRNHVEPAWCPDEKMVFADRVSLVNLHSASDKGPAGPELTDCYLVITDMAMYLTAEVQRSDFPAAKDGTPHPLNRYTTFKRIVPLDFLRSLTLSKQADTLLFVHCHDLPVKPVAEWIKDNTAKACMSCSSSFGLFNRRHHCRQCGNIFCERCCPDLVCPVPRHGIYEPTRICVGCAGKEPCDLWEDLAIMSFRKTEILGVLCDILRELGRQLDVKFQDSLTLATKALNPKTKALDSRPLQVSVSLNRSLDEFGPGTLSGLAQGQLQIAAPPGVPEELVQQQKAREAKRKKERERQLKEEQEQRKVLEEQRARQREIERKERIKAKKARKRAELARKQAEEEEKQARIAKRGGRAPPPKPAAKAAAQVQKSPCGSCDCTNYEPHPFKKDSCKNCFHSH